MQLLTTAAIVLSSANLALCVWALRQDLRHKKIAAFFWLAAIGFGGYPLLVDSVFLAFGAENHILEAFWDRAGGVPPYFDEHIVARAISFALVFNLCFWLANRLLRPAGDRPPGDPQEMAQIGNTVCWTLIVSGLLGAAYMVQFEYGGLMAAITRARIQYGHRSDAIGVQHRLAHNLSVAFIYQSACGLYFALRRRKPLTFFLACVPNALLAAITAQRAYFFALLGPLAFHELRFGVFARYSFQFNRLASFSLRAKRAALLSLALVATVFGLNLLRTARTRLGDFPGAVKEAAYISGGLRDQSLFVKYWTFDNIPESYSSIDGRNTLRIVKTLLRAERGDDISDQVGFYIAWHRNAWDFTTLHPTVWGWAYCDLLWPGVLWGAALAAIMALLDRATWRSEVRYFVFSPAILIMVSVVMRGSVEYGIVRAWYALILSAGIVFVARRIHKPAQARQPQSDAEPKAPEARPLAHV